MDFERDYILRLIHMLGDLMRRLAERMDDRERGRMLNEAAHRHCGMPMGTDALIAQASARELAQRTGGVVAPTLFIGTEQNDNPQMLTNLNVPHDENSYILGMKKALK